MTKPRHSWPSETRRWVWHKCQFCDCRRMLYRSGFHPIACYLVGTEGKILTTAPPCIVKSAFQKDLMAYIVAEKKELGL